MKAVALPNGLAAPAMPGHTIRTEIRLRSILLMTLAISTSTIVPLRHYPAWRRLGRPDASYEAFEDLPDRS